MIIKQTSRFKKWISALKDKQAKARILIQLKRMIEGNPGDVKPVAPVFMKYEFTVEKDIGSITSHSKI
jgi:putative addiction module killer protein